MKRLRLSRRRVVIAAVVGGLLLCYFPVRVVRMNAALSRRRLPALPVGARDVHFWTGGIFAKYMNVRFAVSPDRALDYFRRAGAQDYYEFRMVDDGNRAESRIVATHTLGAPPRTDTKTEPWQSVMPISGGKPWFRSVDNIQHGWYYFDEYAAEGYYLYYDLDSQHFYIYWHYS